jgi:hypothetical protein
MAYNTYGAPRLSSYAEALKWYNDTKPIRGHEKAVRPLGYRRYHMCASIELDAGDVVLVYEGFPCVTWRPGDTFTVAAPHWYNAFQAEKMIGMVPRGMSFEWNKGRLFVTTGFGAHKHHLPRGSSLLFARDGEHTDKTCRFVCVSDEPPVQYKAVRNAQDKLVEKHFTPFISWMRVVLNSDEHLTLDESYPAYDKFCTELGYSEAQKQAQARAIDPLPYSNEHKKAVNRFLGQLSRLPFPDSGGDRAFSRPACELMFSRLTGEDPTHWPDMLMIIRRRAGKYRYMRGRAGFVTSHDDVMRYLKQLVAFLFRDQVFVAEQLERGQIPSKCNAHFFNDVKHIF